MRGLINIDNKDNECFRWSLVRYFSLLKNPAIIRNVDKKFAKQLNYKNVNFPVYKKEYSKIEKQNNISISMFSYQKKKTLYRIYTSKQTFEKHIDLLLISNVKKLYHVLIKDFNRFTTNKINHHGKKAFLLILLTILQHFNNIRKPHKNLSRN